jgi:hypothetical protein
LRKIMKNANDIINELGYKERTDTHLRTITLRSDELVAALEFAIEQGAKRERSLIAEWLRNVGKLGFERENSSLIGNMCQHLAVEVISERYKK